MSVEASTFNKAEGKTNNSQVLVYPDGTRTLTRRELLTTRVAIGLALGALLLLGCAAMARGQIQSSSVKQK